MQTKQQPYIVIRTIAPKIDHWSEILNQSVGAKTKMSQKCAAAWIARAKDIFFIILLRACKTLGDGAIHSLWRHTIHGQILEKRKNGAEVEQKTGFTGKAHLRAGLRLVKTQHSQLRNFYLHPPLNTLTPFIFHSPQTSSDPILCWYLHLASGYVQIDPLVPLRMPKGSPRTKLNLIYFCLNNWHICIMEILKSITKVGRSL